MSAEIQFIIHQLKDAYEGDPWFGRCIKSLILEVDEELAFQKWKGQHSVLELLWHMITWREFTISRLKKNGSLQLHYFEENDWRTLDHEDKTLWRKGIVALEATQRELLHLLEQADDGLLSEAVAERSYDFRKLLHGIIQHDIYHVGQSAYLRKLYSSA